MSKGKFVLNTSGVRELLKSEELRTVVEEYASRIAKTAGNGFTANARVSNRAVARVIAETDEAMRDCEDNNTLLKAAG